MGRDIRQNGEGTVRQPAISGNPPPGSRRLPSIILQSVTVIDAGTLQLGRVPQAQGTGQQGR